MSDRRKFYCVLAGAALVLLVIALVAIGWLNFTWGDPGPQPPLPNPRHPVGALGYRP